MCFSWESVTALDFSSSHSPFLKKSLFQSLFLAPFFSPTRKSRLRCYDTLDTPANNSLSESVSRLHNRWHRCQLEDSSPENFGWRSELKKRRGILNASQQAILSVRRDLLARFCFNCKNRHTSRSLTIFGNIGHAKCGWIWSLVTGIKIVGKTRRRCRGHTTGNIRQSPRPAFFIAWCVVGLTLLSEICSRFKDHPKALPMIVHYTNRFSLMSSKTAWVACAQTVKKVERVGGRGDGKCMGIGVNGGGKRDTQGGGNR